MSKCPCCITCPSSGAIIYNSWTPSRNELGCNISINNADLIKTNKIWKRVQMPSSKHILRLSTLTSTSDQSNYFKNNKKPLNRPSDRAYPSMQTLIVPSHGNSTKGTLTSNRPGASSSGGQGVDVKHGSYARYLAKKKMKKSDINCPC